LIVSNVPKFFLSAGNSIKSHKYDAEKPKIKKTVHSHCVTGIVKKDKINNDSKKHTEPNSMFIYNFNFL